MRIIKLDAIDSTNTFLKEISSADVIEDFTVVVAKHQTHGKGQMGKIWSVERGQNLTFSVFKSITFLSFENQFCLSMVTALALKKTLNAFNIPRLSVKWPNDILSADKKIGGILIENVINQNQIVSSIIGVGLNVNQTTFDNLPRATSMKSLLGNNFDLDEVLQKFIDHLKAYFLILETGKIETIRKEYLSNLFRKNKPSTFKNIEGQLFSGFIKGISKTGNLIVLLEDEILEEFSLNQITLLY
ncbi:biotin--[acetyl-CoA-carboxylase] ligase [uncultured Lacinutrix sp.]|uniref:biotin--[acetyl-CoA-carboxylase] ligase n=1 Tax=uncultured Lacinutrix sp. TaxID=574032 RepID=UPI0026230CC8|nr:biotin--[acetyl-CoA-carboxylase] ligase [uncultured Lacinutrix sp.]